MKAKAPLSARVTPRFCPAARVKPGHAGFSGSELTGQPTDVAERVHPEIECPVAAQIVQGVSGRGQPRDVDVDGGPLRRPDEALLDLQQLGSTSVLSRRAR